VDHALAGITKFKSISSYAVIHEPSLAYLKIAFIQSATMKIWQQPRNRLHLKKKNERILVIQTQHQTINQFRRCNAVTTRLR
jgi:hypothetical protein